MRTFLFLLASAVAFGAPVSCNPVTAADSVPIDSACFGASLFSLPGSVWILGYNDNQVGAAGNDWDANDIVATVTFDAAGTYALFTLTAGLSAHTDLLFQGSTLLFSNRDAIGTTAAIATSPAAVLIVRGLDMATGFGYSSDPGNGSFDIFCVVNCEAPREVLAHSPEPASVALCVLGFCGLWWKGRK